MVGFGPCFGTRVRSTRARLRFAALAALAGAVAVLAACSRNPKPAATEPRRPVATGQSSGTGATQSIDTSDTKNLPAKSVEELIQGRFAGVQVVRVPGGYSLRIRGAGSFTGGNEPLYIVDGVSLSPAPGGALVGVDPRDIERIEVLKDAASTSAYGVRGANGVILIWTKRAR